MQQLMLHEKFYGVRRVDTSEYSAQVFERQEKLDLFAKLKQEGCSEATILTTLKISRASYYRWKKNYKLYGLQGLEDESRRPNNLRKPFWSKEVEKLVLKVRLNHPAFGKEKIRTILLRDYQQKTSITTVGRILKKLINKGLIKAVSFVCGRKFSKQRIFNGHAQRWKYGTKAKKIGEFVQVDHMTINMPGIGYVKHFSAICPITKLTCQLIYNTATSKNAAAFLQHMEQSFPFKILSIQVDGGSEFMAEFEQLCQSKNIPLYVLPPRSPEYNGNIERINGTSKYEFYALYNGPSRFDNLQKSLQKFVSSYNSFRPHKNLDLLTPSQFYETMVYGAH